MEVKDNNFKFTLAILIALANVGFFGLMFLLMGYFELIGSDPAYFDDGTLNNIKYINMVTGIFGLEIDPTKPHKVSTLLYSLCFGFALLSSFATIVLVNKRESEFYEATDAA